MKRFAILVLSTVLSACVSGIPQNNNTSTNQTVSARPPVTTASYMTDQENELKQALAGTSFRVVRSNNILAVILSGDAVFETDTLLTSSANEALQKIAPIFSRYHKTRISIIGYTDSGNPASDRRLSEKQAEAVATVLKKAAKIANVRFWIEGSSPAPVSTDEERRKNNHVDIILTPTFIQ